MDNKKQTHVSLMEAKTGLQQTGQGQTPDNVYSLCFGVVKSLSRLIIKTMKLQKKMKEILFVGAFLWKHHSENP